MKWLVIYLATTLVHGEIIRKKDLTVFECKALRILLELYNWLLN